MRTTLLSMLMNWNVMLGVIIIFSLVFYWSSDVPSLGRLQESPSPHARGRQMQDFSIHMPGKHNGDSTKGLDEQMENSTQVRDIQTKDFSAKHVRSQYNLNSTHVLNKQVQNSTQDVWNKQVKNSTQVRNKQVKNSTQVRNKPVKNSTHGLDKYIKDSKQLREKQVKDSTKVRDKHTRNSTHVLDNSTQVQGMAAETGNEKIGVTSVLIVTYMRSGSSLTGDILQQATDAFYIFEPVRALEYEWRIKELNYINGSKKLPPFDMERERVEVLLNWYTCQIERIPKICVDDLFMEFGKKTQPWHKCLNDSNASTEDERYRICARSLKKVCLSSPVRIIKTIRLDLKAVSHLLEMFPNMIMFHLVRDPRATLQSQAHLGTCDKSNDCISRHCKNVENNILEQERLLEHYPKRIRTIFYEDIALHPIEAAKQLFEFIGSTFTAEAHEYIFNITMAGRRSNCLICTTRPNSTKHIDTWKKSMDSDFLNRVQERCNYIIKRYNYGIV